MEAERHLPLTDLALNILMALGSGPLHGYGIIKDIEERSRVESGLRSGTLYTALQRLADEGLIASVAAPPGEEGGDARRKYFGLTPLGREVAALELRRLRSLVHEGVSRKLLVSEPGA